MGLRSYRIGRFRIVYGVGDGTVHVLAFEPRASIYEAVVERLSDRDGVDDAPE